MLWVVPAFLNGERSIKAVREEARVASWLLELVGHRAVALQSTRDTRNCTAAPPLRNPPRERMYAYVYRGPCVWVPEWLCKKVPRWPWPSRHTPVIYSCWHGPRIYMQYMRTREPYTHRSVRGESVNFVSCEAMHCKNGIPLSTRIPISRSKKENYCIKSTSSYWRSTLIFSIKTDHVNKINTWYSSIFITCFNAKNERRALSMKIMKRVTMIS